MLRFLSESVLCGLKVCAIAVFGVNKLDMFFASSWVFFAFPMQLIPQSTRIEVN